MQSTDNITHLYFIRHAEADISVHDDRSRPLTEKGVRDAERLAKALSGIRFANIYTSPYLRALQTVSPLADEQGVGIEVVDGFRERRVADVWDVWIDDFDSFAERQWEDFSYKLPGGESLEEVQIRCKTVIRAICNKIPGKTAAIATHGTALSVILNNYDKDFGYQGFLDIKPLMPLVIKIEFLGDKFLKWEHVALG